MAYLLQKDKPYHIPENTIMTYPGGTWFCVVSCIYHNDEKYEVKGIVQYHLRSNECSLEMQRIANDFLWPWMGNP